MISRKDNKVWKGRKAEIFASCIDFLRAFA